MVPINTQGQREWLMVVDDDELCREVLALLAGEAGYTVCTFDSGESAVEFLHRPTTTPPFCLLVDMQMPGVVGDSLARLLRLGCGPATALIAMSGSLVSRDVRREFDGFLQKPFTIEDLRVLLAGVTESVGVRTETSAVLSTRIFEALSDSLGRKQLRALYAMCLDDADRRIGQMREAAHARDQEAYVGGAHAIKGGCGMVGAVELASLAAEMEARGLPGTGDVGPFEQFLDASMRLRRILDAQTM